jgi:hypothetical protein
VLEKHDGEWGIDNYLWEKTYSNSKITGLFWSTNHDEGLDSWYGMPYNKYTKL